MSIESLCSKDTISVQTEGQTTDSHMGVDETPSATTRTLNCLVQSREVAEHMGYDARDQRTTHFVFFSADPVLTLRNRFLWGTRTLRILGGDYEGRPGETLLWWVETEEVKSRPESL